MIKILKLIHLEIGLRLIKILPHPSFRLAEYISNFGAILRRACFDADPKLVHLAGDLPGDVLEQPDRPIRLGHVVREHLHIRVDMRVGVGLGARPLFRRTFSEAD